MISTSMKRCVGVGVGVGVGGRVEVGVRGEDIFQMEVMDRTDEQHFDEAVLWDWGWGWGRGQC